MRVARAVYTIGMSGSDSSVRNPVVAGTFYPGASFECQEAVEQLFRRAMAPVEGPWIGALVPHAGWICSGQVAADAIVTLRAANPSPDLIVVFGAVHTVGGVTYGAVDDHEAWTLPGGAARIASDVQHELLEYAPSLRKDARVHQREHSIEVNLPLMQHAWGDTPVLPIEVPPIELAPQIGKETAAALRRMDLQAVFMASSDLTHYGPNYGVTEAGEGQEALDWAAANDRSLLEKITQLREEQIVDETEAHGSACGGGAIAALLGACKELGASKARLLRHTNSFEVLSRSIGRQRADNFVGYAAVVVG